MRIAYLVSRYPAVSHTFISREVRGLRRLGVDVVTVAVKRTDDADLLSAADREAYWSTWSIQPPKWRRLCLAHTRALLARPRAYLATLALALRLNPGGARRMVWQFFYFVEAISLWDHLARAGIRHVHAHFGNVAADVGMFAAVYGGSDWSWSMTMHGPMEFYDVNEHLLREKFRRALFVICISDFCLAQVRRNVEPEHWSHLEVVHCGVDTRAFSPQARVVGSSTSLRVLTVGRLVAEKGHIDVLTAVSELVESGIDVTLTLVGSGPERRRLGELAQALGLEGRVYMPGAVGQDEIVDYYAQADLFCLPSFAEGVPVVLMEAMAAGIPVVASRVMGIPELVEDGVSGLLVAPARPDLVAKAIRRLAEDPDLRDTLGAAGREKVIADFEIADVVLQLRDIFAARLG